MQWSCNYLSREGKVSAGSSSPPVKHYSFLKIGASSGEFVSLQSFVKLDATRATFLGGCRQDAGTNRRTRCRCCVCNSFWSAYRSHQSDSLAVLQKEHPLLQQQCRRLLNYDMKRGCLITGASPFSLKITLTKNLGALVGRTVPIVGWVILSYDVIRIIRNTIFTYNRLVKSEDRLSLI